MRAYVIDSKDQDISYIPVGSFVYYNGCGFVKRKQTTVTWNDADFERVYCTNNELLNPIVQRPEDAVKMQDACCFRFIVSGAYDFNKGATITEIVFKDVLGNTIPINEDNFFDINVASPTYWNSDGDWGFRNLFNGDTDYSDATKGAASSTLFNFGLENYTDISEFYIRLSDEQMKILDSIDIIAGSPDGRVPQSISIYAVINKDNPATKRETLIFLRTFTAEIDGKRPANLYKIQQAIGSKEPCNEIFKNGINYSGNYLIMNPITGNMESIFCKFPEVIKANGTKEQNLELCKKDPRSILIIEDENNNLSEISLSEYFKRIDWQCSFNGCENLTGQSYKDCIKKACEAKKRNENTLVRFIDKNSNLVEMNITEYLAYKNISCEDLSKIKTMQSPNIDYVDISKETYDIIYRNNLYNDTYSNWLLSLYNEYKAKQLSTNKLPYNEWVAKEIRLNEVIKNLNSNSSVTLIKPSSNEQIELTSDEYKLITTHKDPEPLIDLPSIPVTVYTDSNEIDLSKKPIEINLNNTVNIDKKDITVVPNFGSISWHFEESLEEEPVYNSLGEIVLDEHGFVVKKPVNKLKIVIDKIDLPDGIQFANIQLNISDSKKTQIMDFKIREDGLTILEEQNFNATFTRPLKYKSEFTYSKQFEWNEPGFILEYYGAKGEIQINNLSDKFEVSKIKKDRQGAIHIKPKFSEYDFNHIFINTFQLTDGYRTYNIELRVTKRMRIGDKDQPFQNYIDFGIKDIEDGDFEIPIFYVQNELPLMFDEHDYIRYIEKINKTEHPTLEKDMPENSEAVLKTVSNKNSNSNIDLYNIKVIVPKSQKKFDNIFHIIDPYFNHENYQKGYIEPEDITQTRINLKFNEKLKSTTYKLNIDKYRYNNSKLEVPFQYKGTIPADCMIYAQDNDLSIELPDQNICGIFTRNVNSSRYIKDHGGLTPKLIYIVTESDKLTGIGATNLKVWDSKDEINIEINVYQTLDLVLHWDNIRKYYDINEIIVGNSIEINLLHPWNNDFGLIKTWSSDRNVCNSHIDIENKKLIIDTNKIGNAFVYVSDGYSTHKIKVVSTFGSEMTPEFYRIAIVDNDPKWYNVKIFNVHGTISLSDYNEDLIEVELVSNTEFKFRRISDEGVFDSTNILITDTSSKGTVTATTTVSIMDHEFWISDNITITDNSHELTTDNIVDSTVDSNGVEITTYQNGTIKKEYSDKIIYEYPDGTTKTVYPDQQQTTYNGSISIPTPGFWTIIDIPDGIEAWLDEDGLHVKSNLSGVFAIKLRYSDGRIKTIYVSIPPKWDIDDSLIIFDKNDAYNKIKKNNGE